MIGGAHAYRISRTATLIRIFSTDPRVIAFGSEYLRIVSLNFHIGRNCFHYIQRFQGIGNTLPPLFSFLDTAECFSRCGNCLSHGSGFEIREIWYLSVGSIIFQMCVNLCCSDMSCGNDLIRRTGRFISCERLLRRSLNLTSGSAPFTARRTLLCRRRSWFSPSRCEWLPVSVQRCCRSLSPCPRVCRVKWSLSHVLKFGKCAPMCRLRSLSGSVIFSSGIQPPGFFPSSVARVTAA